MSPREGGFSAGLDRGGRRERLDGAVVRVVAKQAATSEQLADARRHGAANPVEVGGRQRGQEVKAQRARAYKETRGFWPEPLVWGPERAGHPKAAATSRPESVYTATSSRFAFETRRGEPHHCEIASLFCLSQRPDGLRRPLYRLSGER